MRHAEYMIVRRGARVASDGYVPRCRLMSRSAVRDEGQQRLTGRFTGRVGNAGLTWPASRRFGLTPAQQVTSGFAMAFDVGGGEE